MENAKHSPSKQPAAACPPLRLKLIRGLAWAGFFKVFVGGVGLVVGLVILPLLPLLVVALVVWAIVRLAQPPRVLVRSPQ